MRRTEQFQLDVYGELMDTFEQAREGGLSPTESGWELQLRADRACRAMLGGAGLRHLGDARPAQHFTYSKVMAWVTLRSGHQGSRAPWPRLVLSTSGVPSVPVIHDRGLRAGLRSATQQLPRPPMARRLLDASLLLLAQVGFIAPTDPRYVGTVEAIEQDLLVDGFVRRYNTDKHQRRTRTGRGRLPGLQLLAGRRLYLDRTARRCGDSCSTGCWRCATTSGCLRRNTTPSASGRSATIPQAFSHVALINTAFNLTRATHPAEQRAKGDVSDVQAPRPPGPPKRPPRIERSRRSGRERREGQASSAFLRSSLTTLGLALPPVAFITWPTNQPNMLGLAL